MKSPLFQQVKIRKPRYNVFDLSHEKKMSMNMGDLVPIMLQEVVPGDKFRVNTEILMRLAPMVAPVMHRVNCFTHYFFVPNRLVYDQWETFITGGSDGQQAPAFPRISLAPGSGWETFLASGKLPDYMGIPVPPGAITQNTEFSAIPFRAYQMIYNEYYRDQNLTSPISFSTGATLAGGDTDRLLTIRKRCWEKDYFTSALPWAQRGGEVMFPFVGDLDSGAVTMTPATGGNFDNGANVIVDSSGWMAANKTGTPVEAYLTAEDAVVNSTLTINDVRRATKLQEWLEKNARAGSRYIEQILSHFGVRSSDYRLQRPEYLGGGKNPIVISEVLNTTGTAEAPQGQMAGHGIGIGNTNSFTKSFEEHGFIIGIMSVLPRTAYQQGIPKHFLKTDKFDYYFPEFAHLGEQEILEKELYYDYTSTNVGTFGYTPRYAEYKFQQSSVHGEFKDSLNFWHMGRIFASKPALNESFVNSNPTHRIFAVTDESVDKLYVQLYNDVKAIRPMPVFGTPTL